jgi:hypothetical protein
MTRKLAVGKDGRIDKLRVIGFHGEVDANETPGRREAIFTDAQGRLVGIERVEPSDKQATHVWVDVGAPAGGGPLPGVATRFHEALPAYLGHAVVVVGKMEREHARSLRTLQNRAESAQVTAFLQWLENPEQAVPEGILVQRVDEAIAWYCGFSEAYVLYERIGRIAEKEMIRAACRKDESALCEMSWWRSRVALTAEDDYFAAVGLERSDRPMVDTYLEAVFYNEPRDRVEAGLEHARRQFDSLCTAEEGQGRATTQQGESSNMEAIIGVLVICARRRVREQQTALLSKAA